MSLSVDPAALHQLAGRAEGLAADLGALSEVVADGDAASLGDATLAAAVEAFNLAWRARTVEMQAELMDAAGFLSTFADTSAQLDADIAAGAGD